MVILRVIFMCIHARTEGKACVAFHVGLVGNMHELAKNMSGEVGL